MNFSSWRISPPRRLASLFAVGFVERNRLYENPTRGSVAKPPEAAAPKQRTVDKGAVAALDKGRPGGEKKSPEITCPKCGHSQSDPVACHRCGLTFAKYDPHALPPDPTAVVAAWAEVQQKPLSDDAHESFLKACLMADRLDFGARQYRLMTRNQAYAGEGRRNARPFISPGTSAARRSCRFECQPRPAEQPRQGHALDTRSRGIGIAFVFYNEIDRSLENALGFINDTFLSGSYIESLLPGNNPRFAR